MGRTEEISGWGRYRPARSLVETPATAAEVDTLLASARLGGLPRGLGRSYGDAAQNDGGAVISTARLDRFGSLDLENATVRAEGGVSLDSLLRALVPLGLFPAVSPGTRYVTVGGAIAADIHGKNHHVDGTFCGHVSEFELHSPSGVHRATPDSDIFWATAGGMGLTGVVTSAVLRMLRIPTAWLRVDTERAHDLDDALRRMEERDAQYRFSVAWLDCLAGGGRLGRAVLTRGDFAEVDELPRRDRMFPHRYRPRRRLGVPGWVPGGLVRPSTVRAFNEAWFRKAPGDERGRLQSIQEFFHPLDGIANWNRLYGPSGFLQYQLVVPFGREDVLRETLETLQQGTAAPALGVLKRFGAANAGHLSFPIEGWTLALDLPVGDPALWARLDLLDEQVAAAGGRVYLAKDARLKPEVFRAMYPRHTEWLEVRHRLDPEGVLESDLGRRLGLSGGESMRRRSSGVARRAARSLLVLGGTSEIAQATTIRLARAGAKTIVLAGRDTAAIEPFANGLRDIGVETVEATVFDADSTAGHRVFVDQMVARFGAFDLALLAFGVLGRDEQRRGDEAAMQVLKSNLLGAVSVAFPLVEQMKAAGNGTLVVLSSVAAERPRADNYLYAASKAGLDAFFQGMADSLVRQPVRILVVRPGFVHTKMTRGLRPRPFAVGPERVADDIMRGLESRATTIWSPPALRYMMAILRHLPRPIFRRLAG